MRKALVFKGTCCLSFFFPDAWNVGAMAEAEQPSCTMRRLPWGRLEPELRGLGRCLDFCPGGENVQLFSDFCGVSCLSSHARLPASHPAFPASKDWASLIPNIQKYSDLLISVWAFSEEGSSMEG